MKNIEDDNASVAILDGDSFFLQFYRRTKNDIARSCLLPLISRVTGAGLCRSFHSELRNSHLETHLQLTTNCRLNRH